MIDRSANVRGVTFVDPRGTNLEPVRRLVHDVVDMALAARSQPGRHYAATISRRLPVDPRIPNIGRNEDVILKDLQALIDSSNNPWDPNNVEHMGFVSSVVSPLGDFVASCLNNNLIGLELSPAFSLLEVRVVEELARFFGLGPDSGGVITTGGSLSNLQALVVARNWAFDTLKRSVRGLDGDPVFFVSRSAHASITKASMIAGLGPDGAIPVDTTPTGAIDLRQLASAYEAAIREGKRPFAVVGIAGTTVTGSLDPLEELASFASGQNLWFHVDAAWGGGLQFSPRYRGRLSGIEKADSITFCPQKLLLVGLSSSVVMFRDIQRMTRLIRTSFPYVRDSDGFINLCEIGIQGSRPAEILKLWLTLQHVGRCGFAAMIEGWVALADAVAERVDQRPYLHTACHPQSAIVCFRGAPDWIRPADWDSWNAGLHRAIADNAGVRLSFIPYDNARWLRAVFANPFTQRDIVDHIFAAVDEYARESQKAPRR